MSRLWRVFHDAADLVGGTTIALTEEETHHVRRVLRLAVGDRLGVFDGRGSEWIGRLQRVEARRAEVLLESPREDPVEAPRSVTLFQGRARPERFELVVRKATELGVQAIVSVDCARSDGRPPDAKRLERFRRMTIEACKQCGRRRLPVLSSVGRLPPVEEGVAALLLDTADAPSFGEGAVGADQPLWLAVGPESGFTDGERADAVAAGWRPVGLGPRVLRTETAGIVAVALALHRWGDLGPERSGEGAS